MNVLIFLLIGLISGWIAEVLMKGHGMGAVIDIIVGVIGAVIGGYIFSWLGITSYGLFGSVIMSVIGAVVFLFIVGLASGRSGPPRPMGKI